MGLCPLFVILLDLMGDCSLDYVLDTLCYFIHIPCKTKDEFFFSLIASFFYHPF